MNDVDLVAALLNRAGITPNDEELAALGDAMATLKERVDRQYAASNGLHVDIGPILTLLTPDCSGDAVPSSDAVNR